MGFKEENDKERMRFVVEWAEYVRTHPDREWSRQQNILINSGLKTANMTKEQYLLLKDEEGKYNKVKNNKK